MLRTRVVEGVAAFDTTWLTPLHDALDAAPAPVTFFFRDDDAGRATPRLLELLDRFGALGAPLDLAVIPAALDASLAVELRARRGAGAVGLHQHGLAHANHETTGRKCEFGPARSRPRQREDIAAGRERLAELLGDVDRIFTPPWNRCTLGTGGCLAELGFHALSREARAARLGVPGLAELPVRIDWFAHRHHVRLSPAELGASIADATRSGAQVGVMFHHALMDAGEMSCATDLVRLVVEHPQARPRLMAAIVQDAQPGPE
jgi:peptidoglycan/xylan/chitin deacetylase (PgdA/CDA1 family)